MSRNNRLRRRPNRGSKTTAVGRRPEGTLCIKAFTPKERVTALIETKEHGTLRLIAGRASRDGWATGFYGKIK